MPRQQKKDKVRRVRQEVQEPRTCPVCGGTGTVPLGFYGDKTADPNAVEPCRSCDSSGVVVTPHVVEQELEKRAE
jgi:hypothetical protein